MPKATKMNRARLMHLASLANEPDKLRAALIEDLARLGTYQGKDRTKSWQYGIEKMIQFLDSGVPTYSILAMHGNMKLPYVSFSVLPLFTCPSAGSCRTYCYSLKSWRYPFPFFSQLQNTILMRTKRETIAKAFLALPQGITFRLHVNGDIEDMRALTFWCNMAARRGDIKIFTYTKNFPTWIEYGSRYPFPSNLILNVSQGSIHDDNPEMIEKVLSLTCTRGMFVSVKVGKNDDNMLQHYREVRAEASKDHGRVFVCRSACGSCTTQGAACASLDTFKHVTIAIGQH